VIVGTNPLIPRPAGMKNEYEDEYQSEERESEKDEEVLDEEDIIIEVKDEEEKQEAGSEVVQTVFKELMG
jgi:hypothetical protein